MIRARVTKVTAAGVYVDTAEYGQMGPCQRVGSAPSVGNSVLVADVGGPSTPDLIVIGVLT